MFDKRLIPSQITPLTIADRRTGSPTGQRLLQVAQELDQGIVDVVGGFLLQPVARSRNDSGVAKIGDELRHGADNVEHAWNCQPGIMLADKIQGRNLDGKAVERRLQLPVAIQITVIVQTTPKTRRLECAHQSIEVSAVEPPG